MKTKITITYKNGNTITDTVNYLHYEDGKITYTVDRQVSNLAFDPVVIPVENIVKFDLEKWEA